MKKRIWKAAACTRPNQPVRQSPSLRTGRLRHGLLHLELLEGRLVPDGLSLVSNWHEQPGHLYADGWAEGNYAYIGHFNNPSGVDIIDISDPANPVQVANFLGTGGDNEIRDIEVQNGIGFFSSDSYSRGGVYVVDLSDPTQPVQLARIDPSNGGARHVHTLSVDGPYLYEADSATPDIRVFDISDPANPAFVRIIRSASGGPVHEVTALNGRLYTAVIDSTGASEVYDISNVGDPNAPVPLLTSIPSGSYTHTAWPTEDGSYVAVSRETYGGDVTLWDIQDPANPVAASVISLPTSETYSMHQVMVTGNLLYISAYEAGVLVYDISDPTSPVQVASYRTYDGPVNGYAGCWGVYPFLGSDRILAFDMQSGLFVLSMDAAPARSSPGIPGTLLTGVTAGEGADVSGLAGQGRWSDVVPEMLPTTLGAAPNGDRSAATEASSSAVDGHRPPAVLDTAFVGWGRWVDGGLTEPLPPPLNL
jgi:choice-of-anchor B domain-containing protein